MNAHSPLSPATNKLLLVGLLTIVPSCAPQGPGTAPSDLSERDIYVAVLHHLKDLPLVDGSTAVYPSLIMVHPEGGPAPGDKAEHYLPQPSQALRQAVAALPEFTFCSGEPIGYCDKAHNNVHLTLSSVHFEAADRAVVWVLINYLRPRGGTISSGRAFMERGPGGWEVDEFEYGGFQIFGDVS